MPEVSPKASRHPEGAWNLTMKDGFSHPMFRALPQSVRERLAEWVKSMAATLGDDLVAILLVGGVARGDYRPGESDVNALVVLRTADFAKLDAISSAMQAARYGARLEATILTEEDIPGVCHAFPLLYDEIKRCHITLHGRDASTTIVVHDTYRRFRIEQELREAQIGLRRVATDALGAPEAIGGPVRRKARQIRRPLRALLDLRGISCKEDVASVLAAAGKLYKVDVQPLASARDAPEAAHEALSRVLDAAVRDVRALDTGPQSLRRRAGDRG
jgi:predicted nucleotidyltransferase